MLIKKLPDWSFDVQEVSASVYKITGTDIDGRNVEKVGLDPDKLLEEAKLDAAQMTKDDTP